MIPETALLEQVTAEILRDYVTGQIAAVRPGPGGAGDEDRASERWAPALWRTLAEAGLPLVGLPEVRGGAGGGCPELAAVLRPAGRFPAPVPLAETAALAGWLLAEAGLPVPDGPLTVAPTHPDDSLELVVADHGLRLRGVAARVPWAAEAAAIVLLALGDKGATVVSVPPSACTIDAGANLAGEPRDRVTFADVTVEPDAFAPVSVTPEQVIARGALVRSIQIAGALSRVLELTVEYVQARSQFGRPLARFQAVQQELARLAGEVAASAAAVEAAVRAATCGDPTYEIAAAKVRSGEAASAVARIAHQLHGAIGYTEEHQLHRYTTRLWSWRDEFGAERDWAARLGQFAAGRGAAGYWDWFTYDTIPASADR
jgi:acyl-CoA dehydrogenase